MVEQVYQRIAIYATLGAGRTPIGIKLTILCALVLGTPAQSGSIRQGMGKTHANAANRRAILPLCTLAERGL